MGQNSNQNTQSKTINIEVLNIKKIDNAGNLKALADFRLNQSEFYSWRIIHEGKHPWVSCPQDSWEADGKKHYKPLIKFPKNLMDIVSSAILNAYDESNNTGI